MILVLQRSLPVDSDRSAGRGPTKLMSDSTIQINGETASLPESAALVDVLRAHGIDPASARGVAVAVNERIVRRGDWEGRTLTSGDEIEIVTARQGG